MSSSANTPDAALASKRENNVTINDQSGTISGISYVNGSLVITSGQPYDVPPSISSSNGVHKITLHAGREGSESVANTFNNTCGGSANEYAPDGGGGTPDKLNFFFGVTISFTTGGSATVYLGQGHFAFTNNWWIGGAPVFSEDVPRLEYTSGNTVYTFEMSGNEDTFDLKLTDTRPVSPIKNVFVLMLENHSFDNMLALSGIPGIKAATTTDSNSYNGQTYYFQGDAPGSMPSDPGHEFCDTLEQLAGQGAKYPPHGQYPKINNSGFAANYAVTTTEGLKPPECDIGDIMKGFDTQSQLTGMYQLASQFVLCDQWFSSLPGPTWPNRFFLHGASSNGLDHSPNSFEIGEWETVDGFHYPHGSIFDAMTAAGITWRLYHDTSGPLEGSVSQVSAIHNIELWDVHELSTFESDIQSGSYPYQYTFIEPNYGDIVNGTYEGGSSQHPMDGVANGDALITKVYETIRNSPIWNQSMLIITYDEHGGFYDHFPPGCAQPPDDGGDFSKYNKSGFTWAQYGVRVPAIIVSPWLGNHVDHTVYDHSSVLKTLEYLFGLQPLTRRDAHAAPISGVVPKVGTRRNDGPARLNRPQPQEPPKPRLTPQERAARELEPIPEGSTLMGFLGVLAKADRKLSPTPTTALARSQTIKTRGQARVYLHEVMAKVQAEKAKKGVR